MESRQVDSSPLNNDVDEADKNAKEDYDSESSGCMDYTPNACSIYLDDNFDKKMKEVGGSYNSDGSLDDTLDNDELEADKNRDKTPEQDSDDESDDSNVRIPFSRREENSKSRFRSDKSLGSDLNDNQHSKNKPSNKKQKARNNILKHPFCSVPMRAIRTLPTEMKENTDLFSLVRGRKFNFKEFDADEVKTRVARLVSKGEEQEAITFLMDMMKRPEYFWRIFHHAGQWNYQVEELGLLCLQILENHISNHGLFLEMVGKVGKISSKWRFKAKYGKGVDGRNLTCPKFIPKTFTRCAELLLAAGDVTGLTSLFEDFRSNIRNVHGEQRLVVLRAMSAMLDRRTKSDEGADTLSNVSGVTGMTTGSSMAPSTDTVIHDVKLALKENVDGDIEWVLPLFSWYLMDDRCADDVLDLLVEFRDSNLFHLPAHEPLLSFLREEFSEEEDLVLEHLLIFCNNFPWDDRVLQYVEMMVKRGEEGQEDSFDEEDDNENLSKKEDAQKTVLPILLDFLDYETNSEDGKAWDLLGECLNILRQQEEGRQLVNHLFGDRRGWWSKQNLGRLDVQNPAMLVRKGKVAVFLSGPCCPYYTHISSVLRTEGLVAGGAELEGWAKKVASPCLSLPEGGKVRYDQKFLKEEWSQVGNLKVREMKRQKDLKLSRQYKPFSGSAVERFRKKSETYYRHNRGEELQEKD